MSDAPPPSPLLGDPAFGPLCDHVIGETGLAYYRGKEPALAARLEERLGALGLSGCASYLQRLRDPLRGEPELEELAALLTIGETYFFRYPEQFDALRDRILPELIERNRPRRNLRIWSAGCATGAEPYSLAILLQSEFAPRIAGWEVTLLATDINRKFLASAIQGRFGEWALRSSSELFRSTYFDHQGGEFILREPYRRAVGFRYHNMVRHPGPPVFEKHLTFDLILCRNVMIYFDRAVVRQVVDGLHRSLSDGGWLLVGPSEGDMEAFGKFVAVSVPGATAYQKPGPGGAARGTGGVTSPLSARGAADRPGALRPGAPGSLRPPQVPAAGTVPPPVSPAAAPRSDPAPARRSRPAPSRRPSQLSQARALADQGQWEAAAARCEHLLQEQGDDPEVLLLHALVLENQGDLAGCERQLRRAVFLEPGGALPRFHLGLLLLRCGALPEAESALSTVVRITGAMDPRHPFDPAAGIDAETLKDAAEAELAALGRR